MIPRLCTVILCLASFGARADTASSTFHPEIFGSASIRDVCIDRSGRTYVSGAFLKVNGTPATGNFIRLTPNGSLDGSFQLGKSVNGPVTRILLLSDGRICILGTFTSVNGFSRRNIAFLTTTGNLDPTFAPPVDAIPGAPTYVAMDSSKRILVACRGLAKQSNPIVLVRLLPNGVFDSTFKMTSATRAQGGNLLASPAANYVLPFPSGKILLGGDFGACNGFANIYLAVLTQNGMPDVTFHSPLAVNVGNLPSLGTDIRGVQTGASFVDGSMVVGGNFALAGNPAQQAMVKLTSKLTVDSAFRVFFTTGSREPSFPLVNRIAAVVQGSAMAIVGDFEGIENRSSSGAAFINNFSGRLIANPNMPFGDSDSASMRSDGWTVFGHSSSSHVNGVALPSLGAYFPSGTPIPSFAPRLLGPAFPDFVTVRPGNGVITGGRWISEVGGIRFPGLAALTAEGLPDGAFTSTIDPVNSVNFTLPIPGNRYLIGGSFAQVNGVGSKYLAIIDERGGLVRAFSEGTAPDGPATAAFLLPSGRILLSGSFTKIGEHSTRTLVLLDLSRPDDVVDASFTCHISNLDSITAAAGLADGTIVVGGPFINLDGAGINGLAKLAVTGELDPAFNPFSFLTHPYLNALVLDRAGRILVGGDFYTETGAVRHLIRFMPGGSIDTSLNQDAISSISSVEALSVQSDSRIYVRGTFNGQGLTGEVARLFDNGMPDQSLNLQGIMGVDNFALAPPNRIYLWGSLIKGDRGPILFSSNATVLNEQSPVGLVAFDLSTAIPPDLRLYPARVSAEVGDKVVFTALSNGSAETYAWFKNGRPIPGETGTTLTIEAAPVDGAGTYSLTATNFAGSTTVAAILSMPPIPTPTPVPPPADVPSSFSTKLYIVLQRGSPGIRGTVSDPNGIKRVEVFVGKRKVGEFRSRSWMVTLSAPPVKPVTLTVVVTDKNGKKTRHSYKVSIASLVGG